MDAMFKAAWRLSGNEGVPHEQRGRGHLRHVDAPDEEAEPVDVSVVQNVDRFISPRVLQLEVASLEAVLAIPGVFASAVGAMHALIVLFERVAVVPLRIRRLRASEQLELTKIEVDLIEVEAELERLRLINEPGKPLVLFVGELLSEDDSPSDLSNETPD